MAKEYVVSVKAGAEEVCRVLKDGMDHVELVSEDVFSGPNGFYVSVLLYEQYFMRVGNQLALMLVLSGDSSHTKVKSCACAGSRDLFLNFDLGSAGDFAYEPLDILKKAFPGRVCGI